MHDDVALVDMTSREPTLTHVIPGRKPVGGVTSLGDDVFVMRRNSRQIEVYDAVTFTLRRCLAVPQLGLQHYGLAVCPSNKCLYASDWDNNSVHRVELTGSNAVMQWSVARRPTGLTVNRAQNLLVVSHSECKLQEFTTHGTLLSNVQLQLHNGRPWHAIDLTNGQFVVSFRGPMHGVRLVGDKGAVIASHGGQRGGLSSLTEMNHPAHLAVDKHGNILVADELNHRMVVLNRSLSSVHHHKMPYGGYPNNPYSIWHDKSRDRLYIGDCGGGRVIVIDSVKDFSKPTSQI